MNERPIISAERAGQRGPPPPGARAPAISAAAARTSAGGDRTAGFKGPPISPAARDVNREAARAGARCAPAFVLPRRGESAALTHSRAGPKIAG